MGNIINIDIRELEENDIFDKDELIISKGDNRMVTIRREPDANEIRCFYYDFFDVHDGFVHNNGYGEVYSGESHYNNYKNRLKERGLW